MPEPNPSNFLSDPLTDVSRKERRNLLIASTSGILVATMGLVPTGISVIGVEFLPPAQNSFVILMAFVVAYFVFAFVVCGVSDFFIWCKNYHNYLLEVVETNQNWSQEDQQRYDELRKHVPRIHWLYAWLKPIGFTRVVFEFILPVLVGCISLYLLLLKICFP